MTKENTLPQHVLQTKWPIAGKRWDKEISKTIEDTVGVYALVWNNYAYVGMTCSSGGFKMRWSHHHRKLFVVKRANSTTKKFRTFIKENGLTSQDFDLFVIKSWVKPPELAERTFSDEIAIAEREIYNLYVDNDFILLNNEIPRGTGYAISVKKRRKKSPKRVVV